MNFLTSLLPGLRDIRTPLAVGGIFTAALWLGIYPWHAHLGGYSTLVTLVGSLPDAIRLPMFSFAVYVVGAVLVAGQRAVGFHISSDAPLVDAFNRRFKVRADAAEGLFNSAVSSRFPNLSGPSQRRLLTMPFYSEFELARVPLAKNSPAQFDRYDRLKSEAEFRLSIAPSLLLLGVAVAVTSSSLLWAALPLGVAALVSYVLVWNGLALYWEAEEMLATSLIYGDASTPMLDRFGELARGIGEHEEARFVATALAFLVGIGRSVDAVRFLRSTFEDWSPDVQYPDWRANSAEILQHIPTYNADQVAKAVRTHKVGLGSGIQVTDEFLKSWEEIRAERAASAN